MANAGCHGGAGGYVSMYTINPATGALASIGPPVSSQDTVSDSVTVDPSGKFVYVTSVGDDFSSDGTVVMYTINATTGALTATGGISGNCPGLCVPRRWPWIHPASSLTWRMRIASQQRRDVHHQRNDWGLNVNRSDRRRRLCRLHGRGSIWQIRLCGDCSNSESAGNVSMYTINATTGALASIGTIAAGTNPASVAVDPVWQVRLCGELCARTTSRCTPSTPRPGP